MPPQQRQRCCDGCSCARTCWPERRRPSKLPSPCLCSCCWRSWFWSYWWALRCDTILPCVTLRPTLHSPLASGGARAADSVHEGFRVVPGRYHAAHAGGANLWRAAVSRPCYAGAAPLHAGAVSPGCHCNVRAHRYLLMLGTMANAEQALHHTKLLKVRPRAHAMQCAASLTPSTLGDHRATEQNGRASASWYAPFSMYVAARLPWPSARRGPVVLPERVDAVTSAHCVVSRRQPSASASRIMPTSVPRTARTICTARPSSHNRRRVLTQVRVHVPARRTVVRRAPHAGFVLVSRARVWTPCTCTRAHAGAIDLEDEVDMAELISLAMEILKERDRPLKVRQGCYACRGWRRGDRDAGRLV